MCYLPFIDLDLALAIYRGTLGLELRSPGVDHPIAVTGDRVAALETVAGSGTEPW